MNSFAGPSLEKYCGTKSRFTCPACGHPKTFTRYINPDTNSYYADNVGKCDREINCGYHFKPSQYLKEHPETRTPGRRRKAKPWEAIVPMASTKQEPEEISYFTIEEVWETLRGYERNPFIAFLKRLDIPEYEIQRITKLYFIGTSKRFGGNVIFWQVDHKCRVHTGKIMAYNPVTGRRRKETPPTWAHKAAKKEGVFQSCCFGEHLAGIERNHKIAIVESEKTAVICSIYLKNIFPSYTWIATGGLNNLTAEKLSPFKNRELILFPDLGAMEKWKKKAGALRGYQFKISIFLENIASETSIQAGYDLADYLTEYPLYHFRPDLFQSNEPCITPEELNTTLNRPADEKACIVTTPETDIDEIAESHINERNNYHADDATREYWDNSLKEIENILTSTGIPSEPKRICAGVVVINPQLFITSHLDTIKNNMYHKGILPYLDRLLNFLQSIQTKNE